MRAPARITIAFLIATLTASSLAGCAPDELEAGDVVDIDEATFETGSWAAVEIPMPDAAYTIEEIGITDEIVDDDGERITAPSGTVFVVAGRIGRDRDSSATHLHREVEATTSLSVVSDGIESEIGRHDALLVPGDGTDARLVLSFDGRDVLVDPATGELAEGSPSPYEGALGMASAIAPDDFTDDPLPDGYLVADLQARGTLPVWVAARLGNYHPDRGWAEDGRAWLDVRVHSWSPVYMGYDDGDDIALAHAEAAIVSAQARLGETTHTVNLTPVGEEGDRGIESVGLLDVSSEEAEVVVTVGLALSNGPDWPAGMPDLDVVASTTSDPIPLDVR